jgi:general secretion pathway protein C
MQLLAPSTTIAPARVADPTVLPDLQLAAQVFGSTRAAAAVSVPPSNLQVMGIVAAGRLGSAIISVDGQHARMFSVGAAITPTQRLAAVGKDAVLIESQGQRTELPAPPRASLAVLTSGPSRSAAGDAAAAMANPVPPAAPPPGGAVGAGAPPGAGLPGVVTPGSQPVPPAPISGQPGIWPAQTGIVPTQPGLMPVPPEAAPLSSPNGAAGDAGQPGGVDTARQVRSMNR